MQSGPDGTDSATQDVAQVTETPAPVEDPETPVLDAPVVAAATPEVTPEPDEEVVEATPEVPAEDTGDDIAVAASEPEGTSEPVLEVVPEVVADAAPAAEPEPEVQVIEVPTLADNTQPLVTDALDSEGLDIASLPAEAFSVVETPVPGDAEASDVVADLPPTRPEPRTIAVAPVLETVPVLDTVAPVQAPVEVATTEAETPDVVVAEASEDDSANNMLDFFMAMQPSDGSSGQPEVATAPVITASVAPVIEEPTPTVSRDTPAQVISTPSVISQVVSKLPFTLSDSEPGVITSIPASGPAWLTESTRIVSINGAPVASNTEIEETIQALGDSSASGSFEVIDGFATGLNGTAFDSSMTGKKELLTLLLNGLQFVSRQNGTKWSTEVAVAPPASNFQVGDRLMTYVVTYEDLDGPETLKSILERELAGGVSSFNFAISRNGETWIEAFSLAALNQ